MNFYDTRSNYLKLKEELSKVRTQDDLRIVKRHIVENLNFLDDKQVDNLIKLYNSKGVHDNFKEELKLRESILESEDDDIILDKEEEYVDIDDDENFIEECDLTEDEKSKKVKITNIEPYYTMEDIDPEAASDLGMTNEEYLDVSINIIKNYFKETLGEPFYLNVPEKYFIGEDELNEYISDYISDETGYLVDSFDYEVEEDNDDVEEAYSRNSHKMNNIIDKISDILDNLGVDYQGDIENGIAVSPENFNKVIAALDENNIEYNLYDENRASKGYKGISFFESLKEEKQETPSIVKIDDAGIRMSDGTNWSIQWWFLENVLTNLSKELKEKYNISKFKQSFTWKGTHIVIYFYPEDMKSITAKNKNEVISFVNSCLEKYDKYNSKFKVQFVINSNDKYLDIRLIAFDEQKYTDELIVTSDKSLKEDYNDLEDSWDDIAQELVDKILETFPDANINTNDIIFDDSRAWSLYVNGNKLGLPVYKFGAYRNYSGGGVRGPIQHNGRTQDGTVKLGQFFADKLAEIENIINSGSEDAEEWDKPTGVLLNKESLKNNKLKEAHYNDETGKVEPDLFYGVPEVEFIYHGEWNDPEIAYKGNLYNYHDLEDSLWELFEEDVENGDVVIDTTGYEEFDDPENEARLDAFAQWVKDNASLVYDEIELLEPTDTYEESLKEGADGNTILNKIIKYKKQGISKEEIINKVSFELDVDKDIVAGYFKDLKESKRSFPKRSLKENSQEIDRQLFVSLVRLGDNPWDGYSILNDGNFIARIYAQSDEEAKQKFQDYISKREIITEDKDLNESDENNGNIISLIDMEEGQSGKLLQDIPYDYWDEMIEGYEYDEDLLNWAKNLFVKGEFEGDEVAFIPKGTIIKLIDKEGPGGGWPVFEVNGEDLDFAGEIDEYTVELIENNNNESLKEEVEDAEKNSDLEELISFGDEEGLFGNYYTEWVSPNEVKIIDEYSDANSYIWKVDNDRKLYCYNLNGKLENQWDNIDDYKQEIFDIYGDDDFDESLNKKYNNSKEGENK